MASQICTHPGNSDFYGLGIRIGIYTQVLSTLISIHCVPSDISGNATSNLIFISALILAFVQQISNGSNLLIAEAFVIMQLILVFFLTVTPNGIYLLCTEWIVAFLNGSILKETLKDVAASAEVGKSLLYFRSVSKLGSAFHRISPLKRSVRQGLILVTASLNLWFWVAGIPDMENHTRTGCPTFVFFFAPVILTSTIRAVFVAGASIYLVYHSWIYVVRLIIIPIKAEVDLKETFQNILSSFDPRFQHENDLTLAEQNELL